MDPEARDRAGAPRGLDLPQPPPQLAVGIHDSIKRAILAGRIGPGERINQELIARELGVSRTPVREALAVLASEGLVTIVPRRGAFVSTFGERDVHEIYDVRELLEPNAASTACRLATLVELEALRKLATELEEAADSGLERAFELNRQFHHRLCAPCGNRVLMQLLEAIWSQQTALRIYAYYAQSARALERTHAEHRAIVEAFAARDPERTGALVRGHIQAAHQALVTLMAEPAAGAA